MTKITLTVIALFVVSCTVVHRPPDSYAPKSSSAPPPRSNTPPAPQSGPGAPPPAPRGQPVFESSLTLNYDAGHAVAFAAAKKLIGPPLLKYTGEDESKEKAWATSFAGSTFARVETVRKRHRTYVTFYFRVWGGRANQQLVDSFPTNSHENLHKVLKEQGKR